MRFAGTPDEHRVLMAALATRAATLRRRMAGFEQDGRTDLMERHRAEMEAIERLQNDARRALTFVEPGGAPPRAR